VLSRWAWERKGRPDLLRETLPFWIAFGVATLISYGFTKLGYDMAAWMHLHGVRNVLVVEVIYFIGNVVTFLMRFVFFHYVLFADRKGRAKHRAGASQRATEPLEPLIVTDIKKALSTSGANAGWL
jgi:hypothetical protein